MTGIRQWVTANRLQVAVTVILALLLAAATWSSAKATGKWQQATREEARSTTARVETVRFVYQSELPLAIGLAQARVRRDAVRSLHAEGEPEVAGEAATADRLVAQLQMNADQTGNGLAHSHDYATPGGWYDVPRRLGDVLHTDQVTALDSSAATMQAGDRWARWARGWALLALAVAAAYVVQSAVRGRRRRRRAHPSPPDVGLIPTPWDEPRRRRLVAVMALAAWLALPMLTAEQLALSTDSARSAAESSRLISQLSGAATVSQVRNGAASDLQMRGIDLAMRGLARQYAATFDGSRGQDLLGIAEQRAGERWGELSSAMVEVPGTADGVDAITIEWLASEPSDWEHIRSQQERVQLASERAGSFSDAVALSVLMAALAATAATVARLPGALRRSASLLAAGLLGLATLVAVVAAFAVR
jgi:FlaG/FlaF family flagellin (archaellin)